MIDTSRQRGRLPLAELPWKGIGTTLMGALAALLSLAYFGAMIATSMNRPVPYQVQVNEASIASSGTDLPVQAHVTQVTISTHHLGNSEMIVPALVGAQDEIRLILRKAGSGNGTIQVTPTRRVHLYAVTINSIRSTLPNVERGQAVIISEQTHGKVSAGTKVVVYYRVE